LSLDNIKKQAWSGVPVASNTSRMIPFMWGPDMQISSMVLPKTIEEKNRFRRFYYAHDPIVGTAIDLHVRYPLSQFRIICDGDDFGDIADEYNEIANDINLFELFMQVGQEYWVCGEALPFGIWNEETLQWDSVVLMDPNFVTIDKNPFSLKDVFVAINNWNPYLKKIVANGPEDARTGHIYRHMMQTASDVVEKIKNNMPYQLDPQAISHVARKISYFDIRGTSIIDRIFKVLMYQDKLQAAQLAIADRHVTPTEIWTVGNDDNPADQNAIQQLNDTLQSTWSSPQRAVIWNHTLKADVIGASGACMPLAPEWDWIDRQKMVGLMVNDSILTAAGPTYASASVASDFMASWYMAYRQSLEIWARENLFKRIAVARGYWQPIKRQLAGHYRVKGSRRKPILPKIIWDKANIRDDYQKLQTVIELAQNNKIPWKIVYEMLNLDPDTMLKELEHEATEFQKIAPSMPNGGGGMAMGGGGLGMGGGEAGGIAPLDSSQNSLVGMPAGVENMQDFNMLPESGEGSPGGLSMPPESFDFNPGASGGVGF